MNFEFQNPTRLVFGAGVLARLGEVVRPHGTCALLVTGGGSVKRNGVFDRAASSLAAASQAIERACSSSTTISAARCCRA